MALLEWTEAAEADAGAILEFIAQDSISSISIGRFPVIINSSRNYSARQPLRKTHHEKAAI
jgi:hypothetical protein